MSGSGFQLLLKRQQLPRAKRMETPITSAVRLVDVAKEVQEVKKLVEFLVLRERKLDVKTDGAVRSVDRLNNQLEDEEHEASLTDALADKSKVAKLLVDWWFVDEDFGFGKVQTRESVFIHASVVRGAEVLTIGTHAWAERGY